MKIPSFSLNSYLKGALALVFVLGLATEMQAQKRFRVGYKDAGFSPIIEGGVLFPSNTYDLGIDLNVIFGACAGNFYFGGGTGIDAYGSDVFVPVFADVRYAFINDVLSPYLFLDAGYSLGVDVDPLISGGPMINPGVGLKFFATRTCALNLALAYRFQSMPLDSDNPEASTSLRTNWIQSPNLRLGLQF